MTDIEKAYIAGFVDAEGSIGILKKKRSKSKTLVYDYMPKVDISNTDEGIIRFIHKKTGFGSIHTRKSNDKHRQAWKLSIWSNEAQSFLSLIEKHLIIKQKNAQVVLRFDSKLDKHEKESIHTIMKEMNQKGTVYDGRYKKGAPDEGTDKFNLRNKPLKISDDLFKSYLAGFIDGDGCITVVKKKTKDGTIGGISYRLYICLSNRNKDLLDLVNRTFGVGRVFRYKKNNKNQAEAWKLAMWSNQARDFISQLEPFLMQKRVNATLAIEYQNHCSGYRSLISDAERNYRESVYLKFKELNKRGVS